MAKVYHTPDGRVLAVLEGADPDWELTQRMAGVRLRSIDVKGLKGEKGLTGKKLEESASDERRHAAVAGFVTPAGKLLVDGQEVS